MYKIIIAILLMLCIFLSGCGVSQEEYDNVVEENEELSREIEEKEELLREIEEDKNEVLEKVSEYFSDMEYVVLSESKGEKHEMLFIIFYIELNADGFSIDDDTARKIGEKIADLIRESWFDYDYVVVEFWNEHFGLMSTMEINAMQYTSRTYDWISGEIE